MKEHKILNKISQTKVFSFAGITRYKDVKIGKPKIPFIKNAKSLKMDYFLSNAMHCGIDLLTSFYENESACPLAI